MHAAEFESDYTAAISADSVVDIDLPRRLSAVGNIGDGSIEANGAVLARVAELQGVLQALPEDQRKQTVGNWIYHLVVPIAQVDVTQHDSKSKRCM